MQISLVDKRIVIIGGTSGIGLSAAKAMVDAGAQVVAVGLDDRHADKARNELGERALVIQEDATDPQTAIGAIHLCLDTFDGFDGLYHVAGGSGRGFGDGPLHEIQDKGWQKTMDLNLTSVMYSNRAALETFLERKSSGTVLNLSSVLATSPVADRFSTHAYAAAKAGIIGLTRSAASHYASQNIRFNVLAPGLVATPLSRRAQSDPETMDYISRKQPLGGGGIGQPDDLDGAAIYLMSDASTWVTGQVLEVSGGWSVSEGSRGE